MREHLLRRKRLRAGNSAVPQAGHRQDQALDLGRRRLVGQRGDTERVHRVTGRSQGLRRPRAAPVAAQHPKLHLLTSSTQTMPRGARVFRSAGEKRSGERMPQKFPKKSRLPLVKSGRTLYNI